jgi:1-deoxy-D-xylulose-5-phosphate reductoisomerase
VLNATNEEAVAAFLDGRVSFTAIPEAVEEVMGAHPARPLTDINDVLEADAWARQRTRQALDRRSLLWVSS